MRTEVTASHATAAAQNFDFGGDIKEIARYGSGHINDTFAVVLADGRRFILQRINSHVFKQPREVMENIQGVTAFLSQSIRKSGGDPARETLNLLPARDGKPYWVDGDGEYWRVYAFIEGTCSYQIVKDENDFYQSAVSFGNFMRLLADYPAATLHETIVNFHNTPDRMRQLREAIAKNASGRLAQVQPEIDFVMAREKDCSFLTDLSLWVTRRGSLPACNRSVRKEQSFSRAMTKSISG